ncbi:MAG: flagellar biosynthetic protein FliR [Acidobacteria bacterium]|nr:flagellar biosynthetic protein FliR [Acidobacteriota bacterium]
MDIPLAKFLGALLVIGSRISGLMIFVPFFGHAAIPVRMKAVLMIAITAVLYPALSGRLQTPPVERWLWVLGCEVLVGVGMGITTNLLFEGVQVAGHVMSVQMGYSLVNILDPQTQVETTVVSLFTELMALLTFLALDVHHWILRLLAQSFESVPPGLATFGPGFFVAILRCGGSILGLGVQIAAPVLAATIVADLLLGLLSKAAPQMPVLFLGPAVKAMLSVLLLAGALPYWPTLFSKVMQQSLSLTERVLVLAR